MKRSLIDYDSESGSDLEHGPQSAKLKTGSADIPGLSKRRQIGNAGSPDTAPAPKPASPLPPLPDRFNDINPSNPRTTIRDDPSLHQGRQRQVPHKPGNWPSHVYVEWDPSPEERDRLSSLVGRLQTQVASASQHDPDLKGIEIHTTLRDSELPVDKPLHISLSASIMLNTDNKDDFLKELKLAIKLAGAPPFTVGIFGELDWYRPEENARSFLVLRLREVHDSNDTASTADTNPNPRLTSLLERCNKTVKAYGQPPLYESPDMGHRFHITIAWTHAHPTESLKQLTSSLLDDPLADNICTTFRVDKVKIKIGNSVTGLGLQTA